MTTPWNSTSLNNPPDDGDLDRLVDGSLPEAQRRELLAWLESEPDGWRRCALAFLEAQTWREAFAPVAVAASIGATTAAKTSPRVPVRPDRGWARWTALAACVFASFALG